MNTACQGARPVLAEHLMLEVPLPEDTARHVDQCPECRREVTEINDVVRTLRRAAPGSAEAKDLAGAQTVALPHRSGDRVGIGVVRADRARPRRRHRLVMGVAGGLAAVAAVLVPVTAQQHVAQPKTSVALEREGQMAAHAWGTEVPVALTGLQPGRTYRLMTADASGSSAPGGSVRVAVDETVYTRIVTAMRRDAITDLIVEDEHGHVVVRVPIAPPPSPASA
jgi:hypothetical protein